MTTRLVHRLAVRQRIVTAARVALSAGHPLDDRMINDVMLSLGIRPFMFRELFPDNTDLLDAVDDVLIADCVDRLERGLRGFAPASVRSRFGDAARLLAESWPLDRSGVLIRLERRVAAFRSGDGERAIAAEKRFADALSGVFEELVACLGRRFVAPSHLAVSVILATLQHAHEAGTV